MHCVLYNLVLILMQSRSGQWDSPGLNAGREKPLRKGLLGVGAWVTSVIRLISSKNFVFSGLKLGFGPSLKPVRL